jgi:hypothetical protein
MQTLLNILQFSFFTWLIIQAAWKLGGKGYLKYRYWLRDHTPDSWEPVLRLALLCPVFMSFSWPAAAWAVFQPFAWYYLPAAMLVTAGIEAFLGGFALLESLLAMKERKMQLEIAKAAMLISKDNPDDSDDPIQSDLAGETACNLHNFQRGDS